MAPFLTQIWFQMASQLEPRAYTELRLRNGKGLSRALEGLNYLGLHVLRHSAGTKLLRSGRSLQDVARHLGHASVATAEIYAKWADDSLKKTLLEW